MTVNGGCACGNIKYSFEGDPNAVALCHCNACRRSSNSMYSFNLMIPEDSFKLVSGSPKSWTRIGESGGKVTNNFCTECGSLVFVKGDMLAGVTLVKGGSLDDLSLVEKNEKYRPGVELYSKCKFSWLPDMPGAHKVETMS
ncbi:Mss4-like protein [Phyllosticta citribraziliensis]|uniref:Mss4-like protein n=1 Tax=Phyllosticta citribraziliensis TaxID=989973 RepID=A0ABR1L6D1_9PEZI